MNLWKTILVSALVFGAGGFLFWGAFALEEGEKGKKIVAAQAEDGSFVVEVSEKPRAVVMVQCNEEEFQEAFARFQRHLRIDEVPLAVPAGPKWFALPEKLPEEVEPAKRVLVEWLKRHAPRRFVLLAHADCLLYDVVAAWQGKKDEVKRRQEKDMLEAERFLRAWFRETPVERYYCDTESSDEPGKVRMRFRRLEG